MREIVLDTETTGLDPKDGHRIIEIGCVELIDYLPTGKVYQTYINPQRDVPEEASAINGIKTEFLTDFPVFEKIADDFLSFIGDDKLVIHNAPFDLKFLNAELKLIDKPPIPIDRVTDTLPIARSKFPGFPASLDALCERFEIELSRRNHHGALLDAELLAEVYLNLMVGGTVKALPLVLKALKVANAIIENSESSTETVLSISVKVERKANESCKEERD